jgi:hypothetical protein
MFEEQDRERTRAVNRLRTELNRPEPRPLHWRDLKNDHNRKRLAMALLAHEPLIFSIVGLWKPGIPEVAKGLRKKGYLYNYAARFLIERLSWFAGRSGRQLNLRFEHRATTSYAELRRYVADIQNDPTCTIEPGSIADVQPVASNRKGAMLADYYVSATAEALEPNAHGFTEEDYLLRVRHQLFRRPPRPILKDGFKLFPDRAADVTRYPWLKDL